MGAVCCHFLQMCWTALVRTRRDDKSAVSDVHSEFPLRLISIEDTIASGGGVSFSVATDWDFHVISHTWTLVVRDWSSKIAEKKGEYNELFRHECFKEYQGYDSFLHFLKILKADGVQKVWFDALCINQKDPDEKSREIRNMGNYYSLSTGCYVWAHGVGKGFGCWAGNEEGGEFLLPRWFTRVWTLQEAVLPKSLTIILDGFAGTCKYKSRVYACSCSKELISDKLEGDAEVCGNCGHGINGQVLYLVDLRESFDCFGTPGLEGYVHLQRLEQFFRSYPFKDLSELLGPVNILREISEYRHCSEGHDEDRVLSILGVLGVDMPKLRVNRTLDEQILELTKTLIEAQKGAIGDENKRKWKLLIVSLLVAQSGGHSTQGMSWAPNLRRGEQKTEGMRNDFLDRYFLDIEFRHSKEMSPKIWVERVDKSGLVLSCPVLEAHVVPFSYHLKECHSESCQCRTFTNTQDLFMLQVGEGFAFIFECVKTLLSFKAKPILKLEHPVDPPWGGGMDLSFLKMGPICENLATLSFKVWVLVLSNYKSLRIDRPEVDGELVLICVGKNVESLHKIGVLPIEKDALLHLSIDKYDSLPKRQSRTCTIGGFGEYVPDDFFLSNELQRIS